VSNIRTAEAIKVVENSQRDINIAFMNELATVFDRMGIDTNEVVDGMNTKWNALGFRPGLVGGHCIGVDPYYFTYEAEKLGYHSQIILNGRIVNDGMGNFVADAAIKQIIAAGKAPKKSKVVILGLTFKEDCPDIRNSKVIDVVKRLNDCVLKDVIYSSKHPIFKKIDSICRNVDNSVRVHCQVSILENLKFNYPKIKFEYNENTTKEFLLSEEDILKNKTKQLLD
jgi:UDP-N-acetyl-D-galactosamine dehydrogenase